MQTAGGKAADAEDNPFESAQERRALAGADEHGASGAGRAADDEQKQSSSPVGLASPASAQTVTPLSIAADSDAGSPPAPTEGLSPTAAALHILASGPPQLPESMARFGHAAVLPDFSHMGSSPGGGGGIGDEESGILPELQLPEEPSVWRTRSERLARTVFGAVLTCHCEVNDEVRLTVWMLALAAALIWAGFLIAETKLKVVSAEDLAIHERAVAIALGGCFSFVACLLTAIQVRDHWRHWVHPPSQRCVVRILLMVPVYCLSAWLSLIFTHYSLYIDCVRACYESFVIYSFMILLTKYLGGHHGVTECLKYKSRIPWPAPFGSCLPPVKPTSSFLYYLKYGTLQYTILTPILSLLSLVMNAFGYYGEGVVAFDRAWIYVTFLTNLSQVLALYTLVWLYVILSNELAPFRPFSKFLVVKAVVFFTFWQGVVIAWLAHIGWIKSIQGLEVGEVEVGLQDFLICIEMFLAACTHKYTFGFETYKNGSMKLLMDQRAFYLAQKSYQRAVALARFKENERRIDAGLPPLPVSHDGEGLVASVLPSGRDLLGASDEALEAARKQQPAPEGAGAEVDVRLVRVVPSPMPSPSDAAAAAGGGAGGGSSTSSNSNTGVLRTTTLKASRARALMSQAGYFSVEDDAQDEGDALFDDHGAEMDPELETFAPVPVVDRARSAAAAARGTPMPPVQRLQRAQSSIQFSLGGARKKKTASVELGPVHVVRGQLVSRMRHDIGGGGARSAEAMASPSPPPPLMRAGSSLSSGRFSGGRADIIHTLSPRSFTGDASSSPLSSTDPSARHNRASSLHGDRPGSASNAPIFGFGAAAVAASAAVAGQRHRSHVPSRGRRRLSVTLTPATPSDAPDAPTQLLILRDAPAFLDPPAAEDDDGGMDEEDSDPYPEESDYRDSDIDDEFSVAAISQQQQQHRPSPPPRRGDDSENEEDY
jgi:hypothetical protein